LVKREVIERIGLFDEDYHIYLEDIDFCLRARRAGFKIVFTPDALSWQRGKPSSARGAIKDTIIYIGIPSGWSSRTSISHT